MGDIKKIEEMFIKNSLKGKGEPSVIVNGNVSAIGNGNVIVHTNRITQKKEYILTPGDEHISEEQAAKLKELVHNIAELEKLTKNQPKPIQAIWYSLNKHCNVSTYRAIKYEDYEKAIKYLRSWSGRLNSTSTARKKNPDWRNKRYAAIYTICKNYNLTDRRLVYMEKKFGTQHLSHLNDQDLDVVYRYLVSLK